MADEEIIVDEEEEPVDLPAEVEEVTVPNGVSFDGLHSYTDFGLWLAKQPDLGSPKPKLNLVEVPGMDGYLDMTEANAGEVKFSNRTLVFTFSAKVDLAGQATFKDRISNALHGKVIQKIILDTDAQWYYTGRASVAFPDTKSWKLRCVVTVDAAPYAMKVEETVITLYDGNPEFEVEGVELAKNSSTFAGGSDFHLGTIEFPDGLPAAAGANSFTVLWDSDTVVWTNNAKRVLVQDSDGNSYSYTVTENKYAGGVVIGFTDVQDAGVDLSKVYRIYVYGIGNCINVVSYITSAKSEFVNSRKSVVPLFVLDASGPVTVIINGKVFEIPVGTTQSEDIVLQSGDNIVLVPLSGLLPTINSFSMTFREGKL